MIKNKVLVITYDFFPDNSPNTYRWLNILKEWKKNRNVEIYVVSSKKDGYLNQEEIDGINIFRTGDSWFAKFKNILFRLTNKNKNNSSQSDILVFNSNFIREIYNLTWKKLYFPDFAFLWQRSAYKKAQKLIKVHCITNVITVSWPFSGHVVGAKLKKNNNIYWIADTIDPFYLSKAVNNNFLYNTLNYKYEKKILDSADVLTVLTDKLKLKYSELYPSLKNKIIVNHNIFVPYDIKKSINSFEDRKIKLVFVGTLTPITRSPLNLLNLFKSLLDHISNKSDLELHFYGDYKQCAYIFNKFSFLLGNHIFLHGLVPRDQIPNILNNASFLVNIGNNNEFQEPSKILEYIYIGKPILNVCSIEDDSSKEILANYPLTYNVMKNDLSDLNKIKEISDFIQKTDHLNIKNNDLIFNKYYLHTVENNYFSLLKT
jgi:hypothetical protein